MKHRFLRGLVVAALSIVGMSGCASLPEQQAFNRQAHAGLESIAVLPTHETKVSVFILNHPGASFGLIGGLVAAADQAGKEKTFRGIMEEADFDPLDYFRSRLTLHMAERGYELVWPDAQVASDKVDRGSFGLRDQYDPADADAQLDVNFGFLGYAAAGAGDSSPYRPTASIGVRLVSADGQQNLYTDYIVHNNVINLQTAITIEADPQYSYPDFDALEEAGPLAVEGLKSAIDSVAAEMARQL